MMAENKATRAVMRIARRNVKRWGEDGGWGLARPRRKTASQNKGLTKEWMGSKSWKMLRFVSDSARKREAITKTSSIEVEMSMIPMARARMLVQDGSAKRRRFGLSEAAMAAEHSGQRASLERVRRL